MLIAITSSQRWQTIIQKSWTNCLGHTLNVGMIIQIFRVNVTRTFLFKTRTILTRNADHDDNSSVIELMREFIATEEKAGPKINNDLASVVNNGLRKRANEDNLKKMSKKYTKPENVTSLTVPRINVGELDIM